MAEKLTDKIVRRLPVPASGKTIYYDAEVAGFGCRVYASGARTFILRYRTRTRLERLYTIGSFPDWPTLAARNEAAELKRQIDKGGDPVADVQSARGAPTVNDLADKFIAEYMPRKRPTTLHTYRLQIDNEIRPALGRRKVAEITFADIDGLHRTIKFRRCTSIPKRLNESIDEYSHAQPQHEPMTIDRALEAAGVRLASDGPGFSVSTPRAKRSNEVEAHNCRDYQTPSNDAGWSVHSTMAYHPAG